MTFIELTAITESLAEELQRRAAAYKNSPREIIRGNNIEQKDYNDADDNNKEDNEGEDNDDCQDSNDDKDEDDDDNGNGADNNDNENSIDSFE